MSRLLLEASCQCDDVIGTESVKTTSSPPTTRAAIPRDPPFASGRSEPRLNSTVFSEIGAPNRFDLVSSHDRNDFQCNHPSPASHDWLFRQSKKLAFSTEKPLICGQPTLPRCEEARPAIRHFAQLTKRIAKCRKRNPASRVLLRAISVAQITARLLREKVPFAAVCVGQSASRNVLQANRSAASCRRRGNRDRHSLARRNRGGLRHDRWQEIRRGGVRGPWKVVRRSARRIRVRTLRGG